MARIRGLHPASNPSKSTSSGGDPPYRKKGAAAVALQRFWQGLLLVALLVLPFSSAEAGDIFITGHDSLLHSNSSQDGYDLAVLDWMRLDGGFNPMPPSRAAYGIAIIGSGVGSGALSPSATTAGYIGTYFNTNDLCDGNSSTGDWSQALALDCLIVLSNFSCGGCDISCPAVPGIGVNNGVQCLYDNRTDIATAFNNGMDLYVNASAECSEAGSHGQSGPSSHPFPYFYSFLPPDFLVPSGPLVPNPSSGMSPTLFGCNDIGLQDDEVIPSPDCTPAGTTGLGGLSTCDAQTHNHFGQLIDDPPSYDPALLAVAEIVNHAPGVPGGVDPVPSTGVDSPLDLNDFIISLAGLNVILPGVCIEVVEETIECIPVDEGGFDYSAQLINQSGFEVVKMFIPDVVDPVTGDTLVDIEPNVIQGFPPVESGDPLPPLDLTFNGAASGDDFTYTVALMAKNEEGVLFECCSHEMEVSLPICCNDLAEDSVDVHCQDADGNFPFDFSFLNWGHMAPSEAAHAFLLPISPAGVTFEPDYFDLTQMGSQPTVSDGSYSDLLNTMIQGAGLGQEITFELIIHNEDMSECCNQVHTIITSDCTAGGGGGSNASSEASFLRGDANTDGSFDIADVIRSLGYLFQDLPVSCLLALDSNDDQTIDIGDSIYSLNALFGGGPSPGPPHQQCGDDTSAGTLDCDSFPLCDAANNDPQGG